MISYVRGELTAVEKDKVIVDVGGVGYGDIYAGSIDGDASADGRGDKTSYVFECREDASRCLAF